MPLKRKKGNGSDTDSDSFALSDDEHSPSRMDLTRATSETDENERPVWRQRFHDPELFPELQPESGAFAEGNASRATSEDEDVKPAPENVDMSLKPEVLSEDDLRSVTDDSPKDSAFAANDSSLPAEALQLPRDSSDNARSAPRLPTPDLPDYEDSPVVTPTYEVRSADLSDIDCGDGSAASDRCGPDLFPADPPEGAASAAMSIGVSLEHVAGGENKTAPDASAAPASEEDEDGNVRHRVHRTDLTAQSVRTHANRQDHKRLWEDHKNTHSVPTKKMRPDSQAADLGLTDEDIPDKSQPPVDTPGDRNKTARAEHTKEPTGADEDRDDLLSESDDSPEEYAFVANDSKLPTKALQLLKDSSDNPNNRRVLAMLMRDADRPPQSVPKQVARWLGVRPVPSSVKVLDRRGKVNVTDSGYVAKLLQWSAGNGPLFTELLEVLFGSKAERAAKADLPSVSEDVASLCDTWARETHGALSRYFAPPASPCPDGVFQWLAPTYDAFALAEVVGHGIPSGRLKSMQSAWKRMEGTHTAVQAAAFLARDIVITRAFVQAHPELLEPWKVVAQSTGNFLLTLLVAADQVVNMDFVPGNRSQLEARGEECDSMHTSLVLESDERLLDSDEARALFRNLSLPALLGAMHAERMTVGDLAKAVPLHVGLQPVASKASQVLPNTNTPDTSPSGYLSQLLVWGQENRAGMNRTIFGCFGTAAHKRDTAAATQAFVQTACRERVRVDERARRYLRRTDFSAYSLPLPIRTAAFTWDVPQYLPENLPGARDFSERRIRAATWAFRRKRNHYLASAFLAGLANDIKEANLALSQHSAYREQQALATRMNLYGTEGIPVPITLCDLLGT